MALKVTSRLTAIPVYNRLEEITLVGCWAHARRKFDEALKVLPPEKKDADVAAKRGLEFCNRLFALERELKKSHRRSVTGYGLSAAARL